jgi:hypothetical protein
LGIYSKITSPSLKDCAWAGSDENYSELASKLNLIVSQQVNLKICYSTHLISSKAIFMGIFGTGLSVTWRALVVTWWTTWWATWWVFSTAWDWFYWVLVLEAYACRAAWDVSWWLLSQATNQIIAGLSSVVNLIRKLWHKFFR